jgi:hypothetical protein
VADLIIERIERRPRTYELRVDGIAAGTLLYPKRLSQAAFADVGPGSWEMPSPGAFRSQTEVLSPAGAEIGWVRRRRWRGGADFALDGTEFELRRTSWWRAAWILTAGDDDLLRLSSRFMSQREPLSLDGYRAMPASVVLMAVHLVLLTIREDSSAAAAGATAVVAGS